jgi:hypothetical protein
MKLWDFLNSPIFLTVLGLFWASFGSAYIAHLLQKRSRYYDIRLQQIRDILLYYHNYFRIIKSSDERIVSEEFYDTHARFQSCNKLNLVLFKDNDIFSNWQYVSQLFANVRNKILKDRICENEEEFEAIRKKADIATKAMFNELI